MKFIDGYYEVGEDLSERPPLPFTVYWNDPKIWDELVARAGNPEYVDPRDAERYREFRTESEARKFWESVKEHGACIYGKDNLIGEPYDSYRTEWTYDEGMIEDWS